MQFGRTYEEFEVGARLQALAGQDGHRVRRPPVLPAHHEPPPAAPGRATTPEKTTDFGRNVVVGNYVYSLLLGMSVPRRLRQGHRQPGGRVAAARGAHLPRRHALRRDDGAGARRRHAPRPTGAIVQVETAGLQAGRHRGLRVPPQGDGADRQPYVTGARRRPSPAAPSRPATKEQPWAASPQTEGLTDVQREILATVRDFVDKEIIPVATELEHPDEYPPEIVEGMKELGLFGLMIPEEYGGLGESLLTYALCVEEIARGWMTVSRHHQHPLHRGVHAQQHGTEEQKEHYLPRMATGEVRGAFSMSRAGPRLRRVGIRPRPSRDGDDYVAQRPEDVADQRRHVQPRRGAVRTDDGQPTDAPPQDHDDVPGREGARLRRGPAPASPSPARSTRWATRASTPPSWSWTATGSRPTGSSAASTGRGFLPDDGRRRGRPRQRRGPRLRRRPARLRAGHLPTPSSARRSASRSPSTRPSSSGWPRWRPRSRPRSR